MEQVQAFLKLWNDGSSIGTLTVFTDQAGRVILNWDNNDYEQYLSIADSYLAATPEARQKSKEKYADLLTRKEIKETIGVFDSAIESRRISKELELINYNQIPDSASMKVLGEISDKYPKWRQIISAYIYGVMQGKRQERRRKRRKGMFA